MKYMARVIGADRRNEEDEDGETYDLYVRFNNFALEKMRARGRSKEGDFLRKPAPSRAGKDRADENGEDRHVELRLDNIRAYVEIAVPGFKREPGQEIRDEWVRERLRKLEEKGYTFAEETNDDRNREVVREFRGRRYVVKKPIRELSGHYLLAFFKEVRRNIIQVGNSVCPDFVDNLLRENERLQREGHLG
jgi:hypothetical protein